VGRYEWLHKGGDGAAPRPAQKGNPYSMAGQSLIYTGISILTPALLPQRYPPGFSVRGPFPADSRKPVCTLLGRSTLGMAALAPISWTPLPPPTLAAPLAAVKALLSRWHRQRRKSPYDRPEQRPRQVPFGQQQPVIAGVPATHLPEGGGGTRKKF
jgi:hypothetical protein